MKNTVAITDQNIFQTYSRYPVVLVKGKGSKLWDAQGNEYLDFLSGIAVCNLGHCHPAVVRAAQAQLGRLIHVSNFFYTEPQAALSELLTRHSFADRVFFCNSGAEANESALKLARKYSQDRGHKKRFEVITMHDSFHGRTFATLSATAQKKFHKGFEPLLPGFRYVPFNDIAALKRAVTPHTCAILLEPIQGEGGVNIPDASYLKKVRQLCDEHGLLLIFDEVQVGMGRTGKLFAHEHYRVKPDIMTLAKALAGGLPAGAMLARKHIAESFTPGTHASTFGGNPVAMAAGAAVMKTLLQGDVLNNCRMMGSYFMNGLMALKKRYPAIIREVRGKGLIIGMELNRDGREIVRQCLRQGIIINCTMDKILRFVPPLIISRREIDHCLSVLESIFTKL
ncbi:MAG: aspartate aminotransferase family protein [Proteobacteria bacterium]|nr:aspartate aminotransferase family protein [Pseudomonadota bacterium]